MNSESPSPFAQRLLSDDTPHDRRKDPRVQSNETAEMREVHAANACDATILDVSAHGMKIAAAQPFRPGATVIVEWCAGFLPCTVRHCTEENGVWLVGVEAEALPGVLALLVALKESAQQRNRQLLATGARVSLSQ